MKLIYYAFTVLGCVFALIGVSSLAQAQDGASANAPAVVIDRSVLNELNRYYSAQDPQSQPIKMTPPTPQAPSPSQLSSQAPSSVNSAAPEPLDYSFPVQTKAVHALRYPDDMAPDMRAKIINPPPLPPRRPVITTVSPDYIAAKRREIEKEVNQTAQRPPAPVDQKADFDQAAALLASPPKALTTTAAPLVSSVKVAVAPVRAIVPIPPIKPKTKKAASPSKRAQKTKAQGPVMPAVPKESVTAVSLMPEGGVPGKLLRPVVTKDIARDETPKEKAPVPRPPVDTPDVQFISVPFEVGQTEMAEGQLNILKRDILPLILQNGGWRLQIQAFATPTDRGVSSARRASLSRALAVRSYLIDKGIDSARMDVRALGAQTDRTPQDRVDVVFLPPVME